MGSDISGLDRFSDEKRDFEAELTETSYEYIQRIEGKTPPDHALLELPFFILLFSYIPASANSNNSSSFLNDSLYSAIPALIENDILMSELSHKNALAPW